MTATNTAPTVFAKFLGREILGEMGRLLFALLNAFGAAGYHIRLFDSLPHGALDKYGRMACALPHVSLTRSVPAGTQDMIYLFDDEDRALRGHRWRRKVAVRFDVFAPYWWRRPIVMPYPVHPVHAGADLPERLQRYRGTARKMRLFFSGDSEGEGYAATRIRYPKPKLSRREILDTILGQAGDNVVLIQGEDDLAARCASGYANKCLIMDSRHPRIDETRWLAILATSDFFLCPPGYVMPMCHNAIEAMAVGAIPLINYPEWFDPHLEHLETCVAFDDKADLLAKLAEVLKMDGQRIAKMRQRVIAYYDQHLAPEAFVRRIEASGEQSVVVLMITDANVTRNAARLNGRSVLMRGSSAPARGGWLAKLRGS